MDDSRQLPAMWKLFLSIMGSGLVIGIATPLVGIAFAGGAWAGPTVLYVAVSLLLGVAYAFGMYVFVKALLRSFVQKLHTLERVVVGTVPPPLPGILVSNEIDEIEKSTARIISRLDATHAEADT
ncbi:MAG: hypothetical protein HY908_05735 [Myxococcales bacterium]|nr:hypothetical protein [Myxococcales bacterium]